MYSVKEVADMLGVHENTVHRLIARGEIEAVKLGRRILIPKQHINELLGLARARQI